jgi:hypothetical protein
MLSRTCPGYHLKGAVPHLPAAFLMRAAAFLASSSVAKPITALRTELIARVKFRRLKFACENMMGMELHPSHS